MSKDWALWTLCVDRALRARRADAENRRWDGRCDWAQWA